MAFDYYKSAVAGAKIIAKFGARYEITRSSDTYDPATATVTQNAPFGGFVDAVKLPVPKGIAQSESYREEVIRGDVAYFLAAAEGAPFAPQSGDIIYVGPERWEVLGATALAPDGVTAITYDILARRQ